MWWIDSTYLTLLLFVMQWSICVQGTQVFHSHLQNISFFHLGIPWYLQAMRRVAASANYPTTKQICSFLITMSGPIALRLSFPNRRWLTSFFIASNTRLFSSFKLSFILARRIFSINGFLDCKGINKILLRRQNLSRSLWKCQKVTRLWKLFLKFSPRKNNKTCSE